MRLTMCQAGVWAVLGLALALTPASAKGPAKAKSGTSEVVTSLHEAKVLLESAAHDYDGHRAKAVEEIRHAIHELAPHHKGAKSTAAKGAKENTTPNETQAQSDEKLKQALKILGGLNGNIPKGNAVTHLTNAVGELNTALKIK